MRKKDGQETQRSEASNANLRVTDKDANYHEFRRQVMGWARALHPAARAALQQLEIPGNRDKMEGNEENIKNMSTANVQEFVEEKYHIVLEKTEDIIKKKDCDEERYDDFSPTNVAYHNQQSGGKCDENSRQRRRARSQSVDTHDRQL